MGFQSGGVFNRLCCYLRCFNLRPDVGFGLQRTSRSSAEFRQNKYTRQWAYIARPDQIVDLFLALAEISNCRFGLDHMNDEFNIFHR
jgi:hypothetical protein